MKKLNIPNKTICKINNVNGDIIHIVHNNTHIHVSQNLFQIWDITKQSLKTFENPNYKFFIKKALEQIYNE